MHWAQESARWSYCPGRASTAKIRQGAGTSGKVSSQTASTCGSLSTVVRTA